MAQTTTTPRHPGWISLRANPRAGSLNNGYSFPTVHQEVSSSRSLFMPGSSPVGPRVRQLEIQLGQPYLELAYLNVEVKHTAKLNVSSTRSDLYNSPTFHYSSIPRSRRHRFIRSDWLLATSYIGDFGTPSTGSSHLAFLLKVELISSITPASRDIYMSTCKKMFYLILHPLAIPPLRAGTETGPLCTVPIHSVLFSLPRLQRPSLERFKDCSSLDSLISPPWAVVYLNSLGYLIVAYGGLFPLTQTHTIVSSLPNYFYIVSFFGGKLYIPRFVIG